MPDTNISQFTSVFRAGDNNRIRRNRATVSCTACQRRKSKCDRRQPCGACEKRNESENCKYGSGGACASGNSGTGRKEVQMRLTRLEEMVRGFAQQDPEKLKSPPKVVDRLSTAEEAEQPFQGATSWNSLVESIRDIQDLLRQDQDDEASPQSAVEADEPNFFFSNTSTITLPEIVSSLPSKQDCNRVISAYFNAKFQAVPFIHSSQFQRRYEAFWEEPASAGFLWISLFFSVLTAGAKIARIKFSGDSNVLQTVQEPKFYMERAAQCLIAGQFLKDKAGSVEALLMYAHSRNIQKVDADPVIWTIYGLVVRLAQRQGYHRDAAKVSASITPFEAEMRRRVWFLIQSSDLLLSFQHGMPPMVYEDVCDAGHPTNLLDADFDQDSAVLPPPRSDVDPTPILAWSTKSRLCIILRRIMRHALNVTLPPYSETMALNAQLEQWYAAFPASLRIRSIQTTSFIDPNHTIMHRIMLELMFRKAQCVLHRPYISLHKDEPAYNISRQICRNSALTMLNLHIELDREITPGGRMYEDRFMVSSLTLQHFLIASTISCLDVMESIDLSTEQRNHQIKILRKSEEIWSARGAESAEAMHASKVLRAVLSKVNTPTSQTEHDASSHPSTGITPSSGNGSDQHPSGPAPVGRKRSGQPSADQYMGDTDQEYDVNFDEVPDLDSLFPSTEALNWKSIDQYLRLDHSEDTVWNHMLQGF